MFEGLASGHPVAIVVNKKLGDYLLCLSGHIWDQLSDSRALLWWEIEFHVRGQTLEFG